MDRTLKLLYSLVLGGCGAFIAWALLDLVLNLKQVTDPFLLAVFNGGLVGLFTGALIAGLEKYNSTAKASRTLLGMLVGLVTGLIGGIVGLLLAELLFEKVAVPGDWHQAMRLVGWGIFGLGVGIGPGIATWSLLKTVASSAGGCLGGILGGLGLILISSFLRFPLSSRALGFTLLGLFVGLLIALAQEAVKKATLKIAEQRIATRPQEGRRFDIDKKRVTVGSAGNDDWVISNDPAVQPHHIEIRQESGQFVIYSKVQTSPALVNGRGVQTQPLNDGDRIQIGATTIAFSG